MLLCEFKQVVKQDSQHTIFNNIDLKIESGQHLGLKMNQEEIRVFYQLLSGKILPSSGQIEKYTTSFAMNFHDDGLYSFVTVRQYLTLFHAINLLSESIDDLSEIFSLMDVLDVKLSKLTTDQKSRVHLLRLYLSQTDIMYIESPISLLSRDGIQLYLKAINYMKQQQTTLLITSYNLEELILYDIQLYRYNAEIGFELVDLVENENQEQALEELNKNELNRVFKIACKLSDKVVYFTPNEIDYIESINSVSTVRINDASYPTTLTLSELEIKLKPFGFFRCHRSYLLNLQRIHELVSYSKNSYTLILKSPKGVMLPLSRNRLEELKALIEL